MSLLHVRLIGKRLETVIEDLLDTVAGETASESVSRTAMKPYVRLRKRRHSDDQIMRIEEGITIVPMKPINAGGTNERDDVGYRFLIFIAQGQISEEIPENWAIGVWEQAIRQYFQNRRVTGLALTDSWEIRCTVEPGNLPDWTEVDEHVDATALMLTDYIRESRRRPN